MVFLLQGVCDRTGMFKYFEESAAVCCAQAKGVCALFPYGCCAVWCAVCLRHMS